MKLSSQNSVQQTLIDNFKKFDEDKNGFITDKEIKAMANKPMTLENMGIVMTAQLLDQSPEMFEYFDNRQYGQAKDKKIGMGDLRASVAGENAGAAGNPKETNPHSRSPAGRLNDQMMKAINEVYSMIMSVISDIQNMIKELSTGIFGSKGNGKES